MSTMNIPSPVLAHHQESKKSARMAFLLCLFFGLFGAHRFYVGKIGTGVLMLLTFGGLGIWFIVDLVTIATNHFSDKNENQLLLTNKASTFQKTLMGIASALIGAMIIGAYTIILVLYFTSGIVKVVDKQLAAMKAGDIQKAYSYTSNDFRRNTSLVVFESFVKKHPALANNVDRTILEREVSDGKGTVKGTFKAKDGTKTTLLFSLIKENNQWKILGISVPQNEGGIRVDSKSTSELTSKVFESKNNHYTIRYPADWEHKVTDEDTDFFGAPIQGSNLFYASVSIKTIPIKRQGGQYNNPNEYIENLKTIIKKSIIHPNILTEAEIELPLKPGKFKGKSLIFTYTHGEKHIKQMQIILESKDGLKLYSWIYTAMIGNYNTFLPAAKTMYESWDIE